MDFRESQDGFRTKASASRREFLRLAAAVGLLGAAGSACQGRPLAPDPAPAPEPESPSTSLLARGLVALSVAHRTGWLSGHGGAAVIAGHYFCVDNRLDERTARAVRSQAEALIARDPAAFPSVVAERGVAEPSLLAEHLAEHVHELRSGGHDAIYASLALRALRDVPDLATPSVVDGIRRLVADHVTSRQPVKPSRWTSDHPMAPYDGPDDVAAVSLRAILRPWSHVSKVGASGVLHWVTHADALVTLEELGYTEVARRAYAAHQLGVNLPVEDDGGAPPRRPPLDWLAPGYWESDGPRRLLGDSWLAGHAFKFPYSLFRCLRRVDDPALRSASIERAALLQSRFES